MVDIAIIVIVFLIISVIIAFAIGANDETFATIYGSKTLSMKQILILAFIFAIFGAFLLGAAVSETVGKETLQIEVTDQIVLTILISTAIWLILSSALGLPISTTHATIGSIIGIGLFFAGGDGVNWLTILEMSLWWVLSPVIGFFASFIVYKLINKKVIQNLNGFQDFEKNEKLFSLILVVVICLTAFSRAGNDCSNAVGIIVGRGAINVDLALIVTGISLGAGIVILGRIVIKNVGNITELRPSTAFAAQIPTTIILFVGTLLGIPLSGSHMLVASLIGLSKAQRTPREKGLWKIVLIWFLTFPMSAIMAIIIYFPVEYFI